MEGMAQGAARPQLKLFLVILQGKQLSPRQCQDFCSILHSRSLLTISKGHCSAIRTSGLALFP